MIDKEVKQHFDRIAENYYEEIPAYIREHLFNKWWRLISSYFPNDAYVLDVGCGDGTNVRLLREKGINAIGIDGSCKLIESGKRRYPELKTIIKEGDALKLEYDSNTFDIVYMIGLLHHIYSRNDQKM